MVDRRFALIVVLCGFGGTAGCGEVGDDGAQVDVVSEALTAGEGPRLLVAGRDVAPATVRRIVVDQDLGAPDMAAIELASGKPGVGQAVEVIAPGAAGASSIFKGEIVGLEPLYDQGGAATGVLVRAMDRLHRLQRGSKTRTFENMSDAEIAGAIASEHGLTAVASS